MKEYFRGRGKKESDVWDSTDIILRTQSTKTEDMAKVGGSDSF